MINTIKLGTDPLPIAFVNMENTLPNFDKKVVYIFFDSGAQSRVALEAPRFELQGGALFLVGRGLVSKAWESDLPTYKNIFTPSLSEAVNLIKNGELGGNVRFYAACRVADLLKTETNTNVKAQVLKDVENAPAIDTEFFGTNELNFKLYTPYHEQVHISPKSLIERRLEESQYDPHRASAGRNPLIQQSINPPSALA